jgi:hypothetical protein
MKDRSGKPTARLIERVIRHFDPSEDLEWIARPAIPKWELP